MDPNVVFTEMASDKVQVLCYRSFSSTLCFLLKYFFFYLPIFHTNTCTVCLLLFLKYLMIIINSFFIFNHCDH